jgi:type II secretory pathway component PulK
MLESGPRWPTEHSEANRRGAVLLIVLICVMLVTMIGASLLKLALTQRRQIQREQMRSQAAWLADSAVDRAAAQLRRDATYSGETWTPQVGSDSGSAEIRIENDQNHRIASITVDFPANTVHRARVRTQAVIQIE